MVRSIAEDESEKKVLDDIANFGWNCVQIFAEGDDVEYSFTVGLFQTYNHPELIVFGLPAKTAHHILSIAAHKAQRGTPIDLTQPNDSLLHEFTCCFGEVPPSRYYDTVGYCRWYYQGNGFPLYQVIWPSRTGLFPWHPQASPEFRRAQPVIAQIAIGT